MELQDKELNVTKMGRDSKDFSYHSVKIMLKEAKEALKDAKVKRVKELTTLIEKLGKSEKYQEYFKNKLKEVEVEMGSLNSRFGE